MVIMVSLLGREPADASVREQGPDIIKERKEREEAGGNKHSAMVEAWSALERYQGAWRGKKSWSVYASADREKLYWPWVSMCWA